MTQSFRAHPQKKPAPGRVPPACVVQGECPSVLSQTSSFRAPRGRWDALCSGPIRDVTFFAVLLSSAARRS